MSYPRFQRARAFKFVRRTSGDISLSATTFTAVDTTLDMTLEAQVGDVIEYGLSAMWAANANEGMMDVATMVSGSPVTWFSNGTATGATYGVAPWYGANQTAFAPGNGGSAFLVLSAGDISGGLVTVRLFARNGAATTRAIRASTTIPLTAFAKNLGPQDPN